jgi:hypothetical protein
VGVVYETRGTARAIRQGAEQVPAGKEDPSNQLRSYSHCGKNCQSNIKRIVKRQSSEKYRASVDTRTTSKRCTSQSSEKDTATATRGQQNGNQKLHTSKETLTKARRMGRNKRKRQQSNQKVSIQRRNAIWQKISRKKDDKISRVTLESRELDQAIMYEKKHKTQYDAKGNEGSK